MIRPGATEIVKDPVAHISIAGIHGGQELDEWRSRLSRRRQPDVLTLGAVMAGAALGATVMYLLSRD